MFPKTLTIQENGASFRLASVALVDETGKEVATVRMRRAYSARDAAQRIATAYNEAAGVDVLDIGYIAIGVAEAFDNANGARGSRLCEMDVVRDAIAHARTLADVYDEWPEGENACVFAYEVAQPFGAEYARRAFAGDPVTADEARTIAQNLMRDANERVR